jgi:hypothetical protein
MALTPNSLARSKPGVQIPSPPPHIHPLRAHGPSYVWRRMISWLRHKHPAPPGSSSAAATCLTGGRRRAGCASPTPPRSPPPAIATEERESRPQGRAQRRHRHSPLAWARGEPDAWRQARPVGGAGRGTRSSERAIPRPGPTPTRPALRAAGDHLPLRRESSLGTTGYLMPLSRLIQRAVPVPAARQERDRGRGQALSPADRLSRTTVAAAPSLSM